MSRLAWHFATVAAAAAAHGAAAESLYVRDYDYRKRADAMWRAFIQQRAA